MTAVQDRRATHRLPHHLAATLAAAVLLAVLAVWPGPPAATAAAPSVLTLSVPATAAPGSTVSAAITLVDGDTAAPIADAKVTVHLTTHESGKTVTSTTTAVTGGTGKATAPVPVGDGPTSVYVTWPGDTSHAPSTSPTRTIAVVQQASRLQLAAPAAAHKHSTITLRATFGDAAGHGIGGGRVTFQRHTANGWVGIGTSTTNLEGIASRSVIVSTVAGENRFRAHATAPGYDPAASVVRSVAARNYDAKIRLIGPSRVVDEHTARFTITWVTGDSHRIPGNVTVWRRTSGTWTKDRVIRLGADGTASFTVTPRVDTHWKVTGAGGAWWNASTSAVHFLDNVPPGRVFTLPAGAPRPRIKTPAQARAVGAGANPVITSLPNSVWNKMNGVSWHRGCPVGRGGLRYLRINYWGFDGYRHRGELVAASWAIDNMAGALAEMYHKGYPIRSMYLVDRFGYNSVLHGGNDYRSMQADNTSAFNCRTVTNNPARLSPHAYGYALDVNTWENPYRSAKGLVPNSWWEYHSNPYYAWRSRSAPVVRIMARHGMVWTYGLDDTQHFDARR